MLDQSIKSNFGFKEKNLESNLTKDRIGNKELKTTGNSWTNEEVKRIFMYYKIYGTKWSHFIDKFPGRTEGNIKNKFYSILKKVATQAQLEDPVKYDKSFIKCRKNLLQFIDIAMVHGQTLSSKRGRKRNADRELAPTKAVLFPKEVLIQDNHLKPLPNISLFISEDPQSVLASRSFATANTESRLKPPRRIGSKYIKYKEANIGKNAAIESYSKSLNDMIISGCYKSPLPYPVTVNYINFV